MSNENWMEQADASWGLPAADAHTGASRSASGAMEPKRSLASLLEEAGIAAEQIREAFVEGVSEEKRLGEVAITRGLVDELGLARLLARQWDLELVGADELEATPLAQLPLAQAQALSACVIAQRGGVPVVAVADPTGERFAAVEETLGCRPSYRVTTGSALEQLIARLAAAEAEAQSTPIPAVVEPPPTTIPRAADPPPPTPQQQKPPLLHTFDDTIERLQGFRDQVAELAAEHERATTELADCRRHLALLNAERASEHAQTQQLNAQLIAQQQLLKGARHSLSEVDRSLAQAAP